MGEIKFEVVEELYYIQNKGFVGNCLVWWRGAGQGYTCDLKHAGKFTKEKAEAICRTRKPQEDFMWPVSLVDANAVLHVSDTVWQKDFKKV